MKVRQWISTLLLVAAALVCTFDIAEAGPFANRRAARWDNGNYNTQSFYQPTVMTVAGQPTMQPGSVIVLDQPYYQPYGRRMNNVVWMPSQNFYPNGTMINPTTRNYRSFYSPLNDRQVQVDLRLPANAEVWFDGEKTNQTGTQRSYISPSTLVPGKEYVYNIKVKWTKEGQPVEETKELKVRAGETASLTFPANQPMP